MLSPAKTLLRQCLAEFTGTALLLAVGLSIVIFNWGSGSPLAKLVPYAPVRRLITGFLFGSTGCLITLSPVGKISGAHINPSVSLAFWLNRKMKAHAVLAYLTSQMLGAVAGCLPLLLWGGMGKSVDYGNTVPGTAGITAAFIGEAITTACLITVIFTFVGNPKLRNYTPYTIPFLFSFLVWAESALSGCSTNLARSFGPAVISGVYHGFWVYIAGPVTGVITVVGIFRLLRLHHYYRIEAARIGFHDHHSPDNIKTS